MANRGITNPELIDAMTSKTVTYWECVDITLSLAGTLTTYRLTNAPYSISVGNFTYVSFGQLLDISVIEENVNFEIGSLSISLSGLAPIEPNTGDPILAVFMRDDTAYIDLPVVIQRVYVDENYDQLGSIEIFRGYITRAGAEHDADGDSSVGIEAANHWADFERITGRRTNTNSQQFFFPGDLGMDYSIEVQKEIEWKP